MTDPDSLAQLQERAQQAGVRWRHTRLGWHATVHVGNGTHDFDRPSEWEVLERVMQEIGRAEA